MKRRSDQGSLSAFVAVLAVALVMVTGMVYDGGRVVAAQAKARDLAGTAARTGAEEIDVDAARSGEGPLLDPARAVGAAEGFLEAAGYHGTARVDGSTIWVTVSLHQPMSILPVGERTVIVTDSATAVDHRQEVRP